KHCNNAPGRCALDIPSPAPDAPLPPPWPLLPLFCCLTRRSPCCSSVYCERRREGGLFAHLWARTPGQRHRPPVLTLLSVVMARVASVVTGSCAATPTRAPGAGRCFSLPFPSLPFLVSV